MHQNQNQNQVVKTYAYVIKSVLSGKRSLTLNLIAVHVYMRAQNGNKCFCDKYSLVFPLKMQK